MIKLIISIFLAISYFMLASFAMCSSLHTVNVNNDGVSGDAHIVISESVVTVIDTGMYFQAKDNLLPYLYKLNINTIDHLFISHPHNDHYEGLNALLDNGIIIKNIYYSMPPLEVSDFAYNPIDFTDTLNYAKDRGTIIHDIGEGFKLFLPDNDSIEVLYTHKDTKLNGVDVSVNDYSMLMRLNIEGFKVLFTGDIGSKLGLYLANHKKSQLKADILKVPHHGVSDIAPNEFFDAVDPQFAIFPTASVLWSNPRIEQSKEWIMRKEIPFCVTGFNGNIVLNFNDSKVSLNPDSKTNSCSNIDIVPKNNVNIIPIIQMLLL